MYISLCFSHDVLHYGYNLLGGIYGVGNDTTSGGEMIWYLALLGPCISSYASSVFPSTHSQIRCKVSKAGVAIVLFSLGRHRHTH